MSIDALKASERAGKNSVVIWARDYYVIIYKFIIKTMIFIKTTFIFNGL